MVEDHHVAAGRGDGLVAEVPQSTQTMRSCAAPSARIAGDVRAVALVDAVGDVEGGAAAQLAQPGQDSAAEVPPSTS